jgi:hypothetical protein
MKNAKKTIGSVLWLLGLTLAICTPDNCQYEIALRLGGVLMFAFGAYLSEAYDFQESEHTDRRIDHEPYPEEMSQHPVGEIQ